MSEKQLKDLPEIGYLYHYPRVNEPDGNFQLDIFISNIPTEKHFDVHRVDFKGLNRQRKFTKFGIVHPWYSDKIGKACAGPIIMLDRNGVKEEAFSFGGSFEIEVKASQTIFRLTSSAPIMDISDSSPLRTMLVDEASALLAQQRATFNDSDDFFKILCEVEPIELYLACLDQIIARLQQIPNKSGSYQELLIHLHSQVYRLHAAGLMVETRPSMDEIFSR